MNTLQTASVFSALGLAWANLACGGTSFAVGEVVVTTSVPGGRDRFGLVVAQGRLYLIGGRRGDPSLGVPEPTPEVLIAPMGDDGRLGDWRETTPLPAPRVGHAVTGAGQSFYVIGGCPRSCGSSELNEMKRVFRGSLGSDGSVQAWEESEPLPESRTSHTAVSHGGFVYVLGGYYGTATTWRARIGSDGRLGPWTADQALLENRSQHASLVVGQHLYVGGGIDPNSFPHTWPTDIEVSTIQADGSLGAWTVIPAEPYIQDGALAEYALANETGRVRRSYSALLPRSGERTQLVEANRIYEIHRYQGGGPPPANPGDTPVVFVRFQ